MITQFMNARYCNSLVQLGIYIGHNNLGVDDY